jgi:PadR family transcriptional regulator
MRRTFLTDLELMILLATLRLNGNAYGVLIGREIEATTGRSVVRAALYAALDRLESKGLATSSLGEPTPERGGRAKRFYTVTGAGVHAIKDTQQAFVALWSQIPQLEAGTA